MNKKKRIIVSVILSFTVLFSGLAVLVNYWSRTPYGRLDPMVALFLKVIIGDQNSFSNGKSVAESRKFLIDTSRFVSGSGPDLPIVKNIDIPGLAGKIPARLYAVEGKNLPIIVFYHGGGWVLGNLDSHDPVCRAIAKETKALVISVDYRLAPEHKFPAAVEDCYAALVYMYEHGKEFGGDPTKIAVAGDSSGGNLSAVIAQMARDKNGPRIAMQALIYPAVDLSIEQTESYKNFGKGFMLTAEDMKAFASAYLKNAEDAKNQMASPIYAKNFKNLPRAIVIAAQFDVLRSEGESYARKLKEAGVTVKYISYNGMIHGFINSLRFMPESNAAIREIAAEMNSAFKN
ncbi:MAG: alpha/beta hydrolase [Deltaproteobacteria bacterium]|nr:alpha/beta hydrolase [Deltaproteobacteria bacterium]